AEAVAARSGRRGAGARGSATAAGGAGLPGARGGATAADGAGLPGARGGVTAAGGSGLPGTDGGHSGGADGGWFGVPAGAGRILVVWGPTGAPGRTMVAVNVAAELAAAGQSVLLIDADSYGASIAASLGLLDESAGLAQACRLADQGQLDADSLQRVAADVVFRGGQLRVLTGLTRADRWPELRPAALGLVLEVCRDAAQVTVIDCGFCLESDEELSYDTLAPRRNAATLTSLAAADSIIAVGSADAVGLPRLVRGLADMAAVVPGSIGPASVGPSSGGPRSVASRPAASRSAASRSGTTAVALPEGTVVVLNKVRKTAAGRDPENALKLAWERFGPRVEIGHFLPWDPDAADKSLLAGALLQEAAPDSPLRRAIAGIVCAPVQRKRKSAVTTSTEIPLVSR
ncbi:MAG TPA: P-loop NTPase, partial [Micrococcaceae bacterium]